MNRSTISSLFKAVKFNKYYSLNEQRRLFFMFCLHSTPLVCQAPMGPSQGSSRCPVEMAKDWEGSTEVFHLEIENRIHSLINTCFLLNLLITITLKSIWEVTLLWHAWSLQGLPLYQIILIVMSVLFFFKPPMCKCGMTGKDNCSFCDIIRVTIFRTAKMFVLKEVHLSSLFICIQETFTVIIRRWYIGFEESEIFF